MNKYAIVAAGVLLSLVLGATVFQEPLAWAAQSISATIVGPLDGNGNVAVHEQGTAAVHEQGTAAVHEQGTANVNVTNTLSVSQVGTPVQGQLQFAFTGSTFDSASYSVPADKGLRIDLVTFHDLNRTQSVTELAVQTVVGGTQVNHYVATSAQADNGDVATEPVEIYADPGSTVRFFLSLDTALGGPGTFYMYASFSGVLTDA